MKRRDKDCKVCVSHELARKKRCLFLVAYVA